MSIEFQLVFISSARGINFKHITQQLHGVGMFSEILESLLEIINKVGTSSLTSHAVLQR